MFNKILICQRGPDHEFNSSKIELKTKINWYK